MTSQAASTVPLSSPLTRSWVPRVAASVTVLLGALDLLEVLSRPWRHRLSTVLDFLPGVLLNATALASALSGIVLIAVADGLARRKRRAWWATMALLLGTLVVRAPLVLHGRASTALALGLSLALLLFLVAYRREFTAIADPRSLPRAARLTGLMAAVALAVGYLLVLAVVDSRGLATTPWERIRATVVGLVGVPMRFDEGDTRQDDLLYFALLGLGIAVGFTLLYLLLRAPRAVPALSPEDRAGIRTLLTRSGEDDSLAYFALRDDKSVVWSPHRHGAVAYRVVGGVMLASGDPLGDPSAWPDAVTAFMAEARRHAWIPAVVGCSEQGAHAWARVGGLQALEIGDEAIIESADFTLEGRAMRNLRQVVNRAERRGAVVSLRRMRDVDPAERAELAELADRWRDGTTERGYSMALGRFGDDADGDCAIATSTIDGEVVALLHFVPWGTDGLSLDLMRRDRDADSGVVDHLIVRSIALAPELGTARFSLNFAVFRGALERGERIGASPITRGWRWLLLQASRWSQIESLYRFNSKFRPEWEPRFVLYGSTRDFARVMVAYLRAEGFLTRPRVLPRRIGRPS